MAPMPDEAPVISGKLSVPCLISLSPDLAYIMWAIEDRRHEPVAHLPKDWRALSCCWCGDSGK
jgi:hypothetical protein